MLKYYDQIISITLVDDKPPLVIGLGDSLMEDGRTWYTEYKICAMIHTNYNSHIWVREVLPLKKLFKKALKAILPCNVLKYERPL